MVMMFSKTSHRKSCLVKICGCMCLMSALLCVVVTVTTTVVHMNRYRVIIINIFRHFVGDMIMVVWSK